MKRLRVLVSRPDRVGDVVLSTPVFEVLKNHFQGAELTVLVQAGVAPIIRGLPHVDDVLIYDPKGVHRGLSGFFRLVREFRTRDFRIAVALQSNFKIAAAMFFAAVRYRVGPYSKLHSYLFYNRGVRQRRSQVEMHETDYNLQLLRRLGARAATRSVSTRVNVAAPALEWARKWLTDQGWGGARLVAVHPGMGGSALNWPEAHYVELIRALVRDGVSVVVTAGPTEGGLLQSVRQQLGADSARVFFYGGPGIGAIDQLGGVMSCADVVVAPSTGPLHLAVALKRRVVTFYPPIRVQSAIRWGPYLKDDSHSSVFVPENYCGEDFKCRGNVCNFYPCMKGITVLQALEQVKKHLAETTKATS